MTAEKSATRPASSGASATAAPPPTPVESAVAPKDEHECLESELPTKPRRNKSKANQPVETTIDNVDDCIDDVSFRAVFVV